MASNFSPMYFEQPIVIFDTTQALSRTSGSFVLYGGVSLNATHDSTSITNGSFVVAGGVGIEKNLNVGGIQTITNDTESTGTGNGALVVSGGVGIAKDLNVGGDATITGNLYVNGIATYVNTETMNVEDNTLVLNAGPAGSGDAGILIHRSLTDVTGETAYTTGNVQGTPNENSITLPLTASTENNFYNGAWIKLSDNSIAQIADYDGITKVATLATSGNTLTSGTLTAEMGFSIYIRNYLAQYYDESSDEVRFAYIADATDINRDLNNFENYANIKINRLDATAGMLVGGLSTVSNLYVSELLVATVSMNTASLTSATIGELLVSGGSKINGSLNVTGASYLNNTLQVTGATYLMSTLDVTGASYLNNTLQVTGATYLMSTLDVTGASYLNSTLEVTGATYLMSTLDVTGASYLNNTLQVTGATYLMSTLDVTGASYLNNTLQVTGATYLMSTLDVTGASYLNSTLEVTGATYLMSTLNVTGASYLNSTLQVTGASTFYDNLSVTSGSLFIRTDDFAPISTSAGSTTTATGGSILFNGVDVSPSLGDISREIQFKAANNISSALPITGFAFNNSVVRSFDAIVSVTIYAGGNSSYAYYNLKGVQKSGNWVLNSSFVGDITGFTFSIDNSGQIHYTSTNVPSYVESYVNFRALTTTYKALA
jgi:hypothetical protein